MRQIKLLIFHFIALIVISLSAFFLPGAVLADTIYVATTTAECDNLRQDLNIDFCFTTIGLAIDEADPSRGDAILIMPGTYQENLSLNKNISISGQETARTIISGGGSGTLLAINGVNSITIKNLTFIDAVTGITVSASTGVDIINNVFNLSGGGTAIQNTDAPSSTKIMNNSFYINSTAILSSSSITIKNNIFQRNTTAISPSSLDIDLIKFNLFFDNGTIGPVLTDPDNTNILNEDPSFVDVVKRDFHVDKDSAAIAAGEGSKDIGAYGGNDADTIPFQVSGVKATVTGGPPYTITISWDPNLSYRVTELNTITNETGGYRIYYRASIDGPPYDGIGATEGDSPVDVGLVTSSALNNLPNAPQSAAPILSPNIEFADSILKPTWSAVNTATRYRVYYLDLDTVPSPPEEFKEVGNVTTTDLGGLTNGTTYRIQVTAFAPNSYYIAVTAYDNTVQQRIPGIQHESAHSVSKEVIVDSNDIESPRSNAESEFPDQIGPLPEDLPNEGCFIATSAYGHYTAPSVQTLRDFRDQYLLTNIPGRAFVRWYYTYGRVAARFINEHSWLKPFIRVAILPAVGFAAFMNTTSAAIKVVTFIFIVLIIVLVVRRFTFSLLI